MMIAPSAYTVFGLPMQRRRDRRRLVVVVYGLLVVICIGVFLATPTMPSAMSLAIYAVIGVAGWIFGGSGGHGLIKPFVNRPPRPEPPAADIIRLQLNPLSVGTPDPSTWRNDERELARRDLAHYRAYQAVSLPSLVILLLASYSIGGKHRTPPHLALEAIFVLALMTVVLSLTLPSAIILWTEPDLDTFDPSPALLKEGHA